MAGDPGRVTFLLVGLVTGLVIGGAVSFRFRGELDGLRADLAEANADRDALLVERDVAEARLEAAERRAAARARSRLGAGSAGAGSAEGVATEAAPDTPEQRKARERAEAERAAQVSELLRLLAAEPAIDAPLREPDDSPERGR